MFLEEFLDKEDYLRLIDKYDISFINTIDVRRFKKIYKIFSKNKFYFINDLIIKYLEIFTVDVDIIEDAIAMLEEEYGSCYNYVIGNDLGILGDAIATIMEDNI